MSGQVAVITGASRGIGAATAVQLAADGYTVVLTSRRPVSADHVLGEIHAQGGTAVCLKCDVSNYEEVQDLTATVLEQYGRLDVLVNNAGTMNPIAPFIDSDPGEWADCIRVNLISAYHTSRCILPVFLKQDSGVIINLSSGAASRPLTGWSGYCTSKAGLVMLTRALAHEARDSNVRVYGFRPGMVNTEMTRSALQQRLNPVSELDPETFSGPSRPAAAIVWLCSPVAVTYTGQEIDIDDPQFLQDCGLSPENRPVE